MEDEKNPTNGVDEGAEESAAVAEEGTDTGSESGGAAAAPSESEAE